MRKTTYQLSPQYEFIENPTKLTTEGFDTTVLRHKMEGEVLLLNPSTLSFLKSFEQPATLREVTLRFQETTEGSTKEIETILKSFLTAMLEKKLIERVQAEPVEKPTMPNDEGLQFDIYTLQKRLSCQPPIDIYKAIDGTGQPFLVKRIRFAPRYPEKYRPKDRRQFAHEFKILKILRGVKGICGLVKFDNEKDFAVIEFFEGYSLRHRIEDKQPAMTLAERTMIFEQILSTMATIHNRNVLHGDIHHGNILLNDKNEVKIIDFDLALLHSQKKETYVQQGGVRDFIPPERLDDSAFNVSSIPPDFRAEVFQIGVIGYLVFFNDYPFKGETWKQLAQNIKTAAPNWTNTATSPAVLAFLQKALAKNPSERFESAEAMWQAWQA